MQRHTEGMVVSITRVLLQIYFSFQQWKEFENPLRTEKVIVMSLVYYFLVFEDTVYTAMEAQHLLAMWNVTTEIGLSHRPLEG